MSKQKTRKSDHPELEAALAALEHFKNLKLRQRMKVLRLLSDLALPELFVAITASRTDIMFEAGE